MVKLQLSGLRFGVFYFSILRFFMRLEGSLFLLLYFLVFILLRLWRWW